MRTVSFSLAPPRKCTDVLYERIDLSFGQPAVERGHVAFSVAMICCRSAAVWVWTAFELRSGAFRLFPTAVGVPFCP